MRPLRHCYRVIGSRRNASVSGMAEPWGAGSPATPHTLGAASAGSMIVAIATLAAFWVPYLPKRWFLLS